MSRRWLKGVSRPGVRGQNDTSSCEAGFDPSVGKFNELDLEV